MTTKTARDGGPDQAGAANVALSRRGLLAGAGVAITGASGVALVAPPAHAFNATPAENAQRYRESEHVKTFYRVAGR
jgi:hypothetical protein